jgi:hypothetical protein
MSFRTWAGAAVLFAAAALPLRAADNAYSIKVVEKTEPPKEVQAPIRQLLSDRCVQLLDAKGGLLAEVWLCKALPAKATDMQIKNGLTYREIPETTVFGAIRFPKQATDYRKQKIPAGVYTLRLAYQPMDGDHMGTAPYGEFCLLSPAADDKKAGTMEAKALHELSAKTTNGHPGVLLLFPGGKDAGDTPKLLDKGENHWVVELKQEVSVDGKKASINIGLVLIGVSSQA